MFSIEFQSYVQFRLESFLPLRLACTVFSVDQVKGQGFGFRLSGKKLSKLLFIKLITCPSMAMMAL